MLLIARYLRDLSFEKLMHVYEETNQIRCQKLDLFGSPEQQRYEVEQEFYTYLQDVFFRQRDAFYAVWIENDTYVSALRLESSQDGWLISGLETAPGERRKGYASALMQAVLSYTDQQLTRVISHVKKQNHVSLHVHIQSGFRKISDYAVLLDGTVSREYVTLVREKIF